MEVRTWSKDTFALHDYTANSYYREKLTVSRDCHIFRDINSNSGPT